MFVTLIWFKLTSTIIINHQQKDICLLTLLFLNYLLIEQNLSQDQKRAWPDCVTFTAFPRPFSVLAVALFIYYTSVQTGTEARAEVKNKDVA